MIKCTLTRLKSNHNKLRTDTVTGITTRVPILNHPFVMIADPIDDGPAIRLIETTKVLTIDTLKNVYTFTTRNSTYQLIIE